MVEHTNDHPGCVCVSLKQNEAVYQIVCKSQIALWENQNSHHLCYTAQNDSGDYELQTVSQTLLKTVGQTSML